VLWLLDDGVVAPATGSIALASPPAVAGWRGAAADGATMAAGGASATAGGASNIGPACGVTLGGASFTAVQPAAKPRRKIASVRTAV